MEYNELKARVAEFNIATNSTNVYEFINWIECRLEYGKECKSKFDKDRMYGKNDE